MRSRNVSRKSSDTMPVPRPSAPCGYAQSISRLSVAVSMSSLSENGVCTIGSTPSSLLVMMAVDSQMQLTQRRKGAKKHALKAIDCLLCAFAPLREIISLPIPDADDELRQIVDGPDDGAGGPFERRLAPAEQAVLIGEDLDEDPVAHARVADVGFDFHNLHGRTQAPR